jgi:hypothetical protein
MQISAIAMIPARILDVASCVEHIWRSATPGDSSLSPQRAAALRALGVLAHTEPYSTDVQVLIKIAGALERCAKDPNMVVRMRAAWALAALCENIFIVEQACASEYLRHHAGLMMMRLAEWALRLMADNDKVSVCHSCRRWQTACLPTCNLLRATRYHVLGCMALGMCRLSCSMSYKESSTLLCVCV